MSHGPRSHARAPQQGASLESVLDRYLEELADGGCPDQARYLEAYPELADALRGVFRTLDFVEATSQALRASPVEPGRQLGEFRIIREVARGGMGVVYEAIQTSLGRRVALKVLPSAALLSRSAPERFTREAQAAARLHHTNIVPVYGVGTEQGIPYYAMQFIEGRSLSEHLRFLRKQGAPGRDYFARVAHWAQQTADALEYAHQQGTIHRDVKPSNLLLDARDNVWLTDFGLARADSQTTLTISGDVVGTARYMSPEQARGGRSQVDQRTDIYSLGATLYELLALTPAFDGESREDVLSQIAFSDPRPLRQLNRAIPRDLETIVLKCMEKQAERRYARAADVAEDCRRFLAGESIRARRTPVVTRVWRYVKRHRVHAVGTALALVLAAAVLVLTLQVRRVRGEARLGEAFDDILFERDAGRATRLLDEAAALGVDSAQLHLYRGLVPLLLSGQPQTALGPLQEALQREPNNVDVCYALAFAYHVIADGVNGTRYFHQNDGRDTKTALGWLLRGFALSQLENSEAIEAFNRATALRPDFTPAIEARAYYRGKRVLTLGERAQLEPMLNDFDAWVIFRPDSAGSYSARGFGWLYAAAYARTQPDLRAQAELWLERAHGDLVRAREMIGKPAQGVVQRLAGYQMYRNDFRGLLQTIAELLPADPRAAVQTHPAMAYHRGIVLHALGEPAAALEQLAPLAELMPTFFPGPLHQAVVLAELGQLDEARRIGTASLERQRVNITGLLMSAAVMELLGDFATATRTLQEYAQTHPDGATSTDAEQRAGALALEYFAGRLDAAGLLAAAHGRPGERCEHAFLVAARELGAGQRATGRAALQECLDTGVFIFAEYRFAQVIQARMQADPAWPRWIQSAETQPVVMRPNSVPPPATQTENGAAAAAPGSNVLGK